MKKGQKALIAVCVDMILLALIAVAVYMILSRGEEDWVRKLFSVVIVAAIPIGFYITYMAFAGDKFIFDEKEFEDDEDMEEDGEIEEVAKNDGETKDTESLERKGE